MVGTLFLFIYWPSFNGALSLGSERHYVTINTECSLMGSTAMTFIVSSLLNNSKFRMEDIINATLAGGVIMGTSCDLVVSPGIAFLIGIIGGLVSSVCFNKLTPYLAKKGKLYDTCGVINLHGIPGILGGCIGIINYSTKDY